jgi:hypothetical protein
VPRGTRKLIEFVDRYLELMGFPLRDKTKPRLDDDSTRTQAFFSRYHLGF